MASKISRQCRRARPQLIVELLETRLAPALLVSPTLLTFQDVDGDRVNVTSSQPVFTEGDFSFDTLFAASGPQQLQLIDLSGVGTTHNGLRLTIAASPANGGDGFANVGRINATGIDLSVVSVDGDLGQIDAGDATASTPALALLLVQSLGRFGTSTQAPGGDLQSDITGRLGALHVIGDVHEAFVNVIGGATYASIGKVLIDGSLLGGAGENSGHITCEGAIGPVTIRGDIAGGSGPASGYVSNGTTMGRVTVGGSIVGGPAEISGAVVSFETMGAVRVGGDVIGNNGNTSGSIVAYGNLASVDIGGSVRGGHRPGSGAVTGNAAMGPVRIGGDVVGGSGHSSGKVSSFGNLASITIGGSLIGGTEPESGMLITSGNLGPVVIEGNFLGGFLTDNDHTHLADAGFIRGRNIASIYIGGSVIAAPRTQAYTVNNCAAIHAIEKIGAITVKGNLLGDSHVEEVDGVPVAITSPVVISAGGAATATRSTIASLTVGGRAEFTDILAGYDEDTAPAHGNVNIGVVRVAKGWIASNLVAGVTAGADGLFGTADDAMIGTATQSRIDKVIIQGQLLGTLADSFPADHFGIVAGTVAHMKVNAGWLPLHAGPGNDASPGLSLASTDDVSVVEV